MRCRFNVTRTGLHGEKTSRPPSSSVIASAAPRFPGPRANPASSRAVGRRCQHNGPRRQSPRRASEHRRPRRLDRTPHWRTCEFHGFDTHIDGQRGRTSPGCVSWPRNECAAGSGHGPSGTPPYASTSTITADTPRDSMVAPSRRRAAFTGWVLRVSALTPRLCLTPPGLRLPARRDP